MNKKLYFAPEFEEVEISSVQLLSGSDLSDDGGAAEDLGPGVGEYIDPNPD